MGPTGCAETSVKNYQHTLSYMKTLIVLTFAWKFRWKPRINVEFLAFEKLKVTNQSTVPLGGNSFINKKICATSMTSQSKLKRQHAFDESLSIVVGLFAVTQYRLLILGLHPQSILSLYGVGGEGCRGKVLVSPARGTGKNRWPCSAAQTGSMPI